MWLHRIFMLSAVSCRRHMQLNQTSNCLWMKHHSLIIFIIDRKELIRVLVPAKTRRLRVPVNKLPLSLSCTAADSLKIPLQVFASSSVAPPHIFLRSLLVRTLLRHGHHQPRPVCVPSCPAAAEVSRCSSIPCSSTCLWECRLGLLPQRLPDQSDSRTGRWCQWVRTSLCVFLCIRGGTS